MSNVLIVGANAIITGWVNELSVSGHAVDSCTDILTFQDRFVGIPADIMIVDIRNADHGEAMLMAQARSVWPACRVIALPRDRSYRESAIFRMGLWAPDRLLMQPVTMATLRLTIDQLCVQAAAQRLIGANRTMPEVPANADVVLCGAELAARHWPARIH